VVLSYRDVTRRICLKKKKTGTRRTTSVRIRSAPDLLLFTLTITEPLQSSGQLKQHSEGIGKVIQFMLTNNHW